MLLLLVNRLLNKLLMIILEQHRTLLFNTGLWMAWQIAWKAVGCTKVNNFDNKRFFVFKESLPPRCFEKNRPHFWFFRPLPRVWSNLITIGEFNFGKVCWRILFKPGMRSFKLVSPQAARISILMLGKSLILPMGIYLREHKRVDRKRWEPSTLRDSNSCLGYPRRVLRS